MPWYKKESMEYLLFRFVLAKVQLMEWMYLICHLIGRCWGSPALLCVSGYFCCPWDWLFQLQKAGGKLLTCCPPPCSLIRTTEMPRVQLILFWARTDWTDTKREVYISRMHSSCSRQEIVPYRPCELHVRASCFVKCSIFIFPVGCSQ